MRECAYKHDNIVKMYSIHRTRVNTCATCRYFRLFRNWRISFIRVCITLYLHDTFRIGIYCIADGNTPISQYTAISYNTVFRIRLVKNTHEIGTDHIENIKSKTDFNQSSNIYQTRAGILFCLCDNVCKVRVQKFYLKLDISKRKIYRE